MKKIIFTLACVLGVSFELSGAQAAGLKVTSDSIKPNSTIGNDFVFNGMGCTGKNESPELKWTGAPKETKSFAVTVYDPDAPTGSGWWHWVVFNIPANVTELPRNASVGTMPQGAVQSRTDFGKPGYGGPCPPPGDKPHHYHFTVYALKDMVQADPDASPAMVGFNLHASQLAKAEFVATYARPKQ